MSRTFMTDIDKEILDGQISKIQTIFGINEGEAAQVDKIVRPDKHVPKDLYSITKKQVFVQNARYAYALYTVEPNQTYYITGSAHSNSGEYPVGGFYGGTGAGHGVGLHVKLRQIQHIFHELGFGSDPAEEGFRQRQTL